MFYIASCRPSLIPHNYYRYLRPRAHDDRTHLTDCNFIICMLFYQVYWQYLMAACFIVLQLRSDSCQIHGYVMCYASIRYHALQHGDRIVTIDKCDVTLPYLYTQSISVVVISFQVRYLCVHTYTWTRCEFLRFMPLSELERFRPIC